MEKIKQVINIGEGEKLPDGAKFDFEGQYAERSKKYDPMVGATVGFAALSGILLGGMIGSRDNSPDNVTDSYNRDNSPDDNRTDISILSDLKFDFSEALSNIDLSFLDNFFAESPNSVDIEGGQEEQAAERTQTLNTSQIP